MGSQNKQQSYPYSMKTVLCADQSMCTARAFLYMLPPKDALTIERLYCHLVMQFDSGIAVGDRVLESIGIVDELVPFPMQAISHYQRRQTLNLQADSNRRVDVSLDLTHLLNRSNVAYSESVLDDGPANGYTAVEMKLPDTLQYSGITGTIELWKIDALFTTTGIR